MPKKVETWRVRELQEADVRRFLHAKRTTDKCFSCGADDWYMDAGSHELYRCYPWGNRIGEKKLAVVIQDDAWGVPVVSMTCMNCGFIRSHDMVMMVRWLDENPSEEEQG